MDSPKLFSKFDPVFVTGGSGFIGIRVVRRLLSQGYKVRALARSQNAQTILRSIGAEPALGDVLNYESLKLAAKDCSAVIHLAGLVSYRRIDHKRLMRINVEGTQNILKLVKEQAIPRLIYGSTISVLGGSDNKPLDETARHSGPFNSIYEKSKCIAHQSVMEFAAGHSGIVVVMPALVMGGGGTDILGIYLKAFCERKVPFLLPLTSEISFVHVDDVAEGFLLCLEKGRDGEQYIFSSESCSLTELANLLEKYSGIKKPRYQLSFRLAKPLLLLDEILSSLTNRQPPMTLESLKVMRTSSWVYSSAKAIRELNWKPKNLHTMIEETVRSFK